MSGTAASATEAVSETVNSGIKYLEAGFYTKVPKATAAFSTDVTGDIDLADVLFMLDYKRVAGDGVTLQDTTRWYAVKNQQMFYITMKLELAAPYLNYPLQYWGPGVHEAMPIALETVITETTAIACPWPGVADLLMAATGLPAVDSVTGLPMGQGIPCPGAFTIPENPAGPMLLRFTGRVG